MARTIANIYDEMVVEMQTFSSLNDFQANIHTSQTFLTDITSDSKVAIWRSFLWVVAFCAWLNEVLLDKHKEEIEIRSREIIAGTPSWYRDQCLIFQYGSSLQWINNRYQYSAINIAQQIVKRAAVVEGAGQVRLKVAKLTGNTPVPLSLSEFNAFEAYMQKVKLAGTDLTIISRVSDELKIHYDIIYDPLVLTSTGESISSPGVFPVHDAINEFIGNLPFNGVLVLTQLTDVIQLIDGVVDPTLTSAWAKFGALPYSLIDKSYQADAGHMVIDSANPLTATINYINV
ncbi:MAG: hypothetical protein RQ875_12190 [Vicingaceae bacterium]|nr:hypothetical protein [Vicingaceae bacterium]